MTTAQLLRVSDVANLIGYECRTIRSWCDDGVFPTAQKVPATDRGQWRIKIDDVALERMLAGEDASELFLSKYKGQIENYQHQLAQQDEEILSLIKRSEWYDTNFPMYKDRVHEQEQELVQKSNLIEHQQQQIDQLNEQLEKFKSWYENHKEQQRQRQRQERK